eukprot:CAMPEP_0119106872 /NCGR_PEP_ID=MMETSP1180-20130426/6702_1 /TAXON_ID=3052 ORGANISM="Chlamydomonas cf sp, Strain CCMP681" /NCGR_SAMPLE_ID=MMETSP1180 /ASSEMBLY_ACC=CAM_ASM_000741 /LENGTH=246 /DNA_ID=CAMNT_0007092271 /DNA_START=119 /DNA_END=859 /DNA_ORIENTATION=+
MLASKSAMRACATRTAFSKAPVLPVRNVTVRAMDDTNFVINLLASTSAVAVVAGITLATHENRDKELEKLMNLDTPTLIPIGAALAVDAITHSIPGLSVIFNLVSEPLGAAAGVAYMMSLILSTARVDPKTLAPEGTILGAQKAEDSRAALRVPFTSVIQTALKVVDFENDGSSGAGWTIGPSGLPRLPVNSVLICVGIGSVILEAASHAPVLSIFMPRVLQMAAWYAAAGYAVETFGLTEKKTTA